ncbi:mechanosensitive ion channel family protein [Halorubellus litoreus]|uniref:Mechanosensitive ion channel family protein n=1 Tax=Halorubellus litoreus TaxID=755308 RepID=A0ABD5VGI4_9EURY
MIQSDASTAMEVARSLNELSRVFDTALTRTLVTGLALGVLTGIGWVTTQVQTWLRERLSDVTADVVTVVVVGTTFVTAIGVSMGVWQLADDVVRATRGLEFINGPNLAATVVILLVTHLLSRAGRRLVDGWVSNRQAFDQHEVEITYRVLQIILWVTAISVVLGLWNVNLTGVLVGAGFAGIVVGMAARQTLGAVLAGFVLMFARPFEIGDWVEIGDNEGIVTDISIVNTRVQTFDGEYVMIPNDIVSGQEVVNRSRKGRLRIEVEVGVDYDADVPTATELAGEAMDDLDAILSVPTPQVVVKEFGDSAIVLGCRFWIDKPSARRKWRARTAVVESVKAAFDEAGVKIPFPQRELSGRAETGGFRHAETSESVPVENGGVDADPEPDAVVEPADEDVPTPDGSGASERESGFGIGGDDLGMTFTKGRVSLGDDGDDADDRDAPDGGSDERDGADDAEGSS